MNGFVFIAVLFPPQHSCSVRGLICGSWTLLLCTRDKTAVTAPASNARHSLTHSSVITLRNMQLFRKGAEDDAWVLPSSAFSPWHCPPAQGPYLHFRYYSVLESEPQHKPDFPETLLNIILRWLEFVSGSDCVCLWYPTRHSLSLTCLQEECLGSGSVTPWLQTPTVCQYSDALRPHPPASSRLPESLHLLTCPGQPPASQSGQQPPAEQHLTP